MHRANRNIWRVSEITAAYALLYMGFLRIFAALFVSASWPVRLLIWLMLVTLMGIALTIVKLHADTALYHCPKCGDQLGVSSIADLLSPHIFDKKLLRCRRCGRCVWAREVSEFGWKRNE